VHEIAFAHAIYTTTMYPDETYMSNRHNPFGSVRISCRWCHVMSTKVGGPLSWLSEMKGTHKTVPRCSTMVRFHHTSCGGDVLLIHNRGRTGYAPSDRGGAKLMIVIITHNYPTCIIFVALYQTRHCGVALYFSLVEYRSRKLHALH
jgi:hypothetical protein